MVSRKSIMLFLVFLVFSFGFSISSFGSSPVVITKQDQYMYDTYNAGMVDFDYCLFAPAVPDRTRLPLTVVLVDSGSKANKATYDSKFKKTVNEAASIFSSAEFRVKNNSYALMVQFPSDLNEYSVGDYQTGISSVVDELVRLGRVDKNKIYVISEGSGSGIVYNYAASNSRYFTAATAIGGNSFNAKVEMAKGLPLMIIGNEEENGKDAMSIYNRLVDVNDRHVVLKMYPTKALMAKNKANDRVKSINWMYTFEKMKTTVLPSGRDGLLMINGAKANSVPKRIKGNTLVSAKTVGEALGYTVTNPSSNQVLLEKGKDTILLNTKEEQTIVNGQKVDWMPVVAFNGTAYVRPDLFVKYANATATFMSTGAGFKVSIDK